MGIKFKEINEQGFAAKIAVLTCEVTNKPVAEIIIRAENDAYSPVTTISANSPFVPNGTCGSHEIKGLLSYGPIEDKTKIVDIVTDGPSNAPVFKLVMDQV